MIARLAAVVICVALGAPAFAHRLDEYLQATIVSVEKDHLQAFMRLIPGVAVSPVVLSSIDTNGDGSISEEEGQSYAKRVLRDLSLSVDGHPSATRLVLIDVPKIEEMRQGLGEIQINFTADLQRSHGERKIALQNHHQSRISAYLVNVLVSRDKHIRILAQNRNQNQSFYELTYAQTDEKLGLLSIAYWPTLGASLAIAALLLLVATALNAKRKTAAAATSHY